jgi:hypothetical protein
MDRLDTCLIAPTDRERTCLGKFGDHGAIDPSCAARDNDCQIHDHSTARADSAVLPATESSGGDTTDLEG